MKSFTKLLRLRNSMKSLQQISWTVSQLEKRYNTDDVDELQAQEIVEAYLEYVPQIRRVLDELEVEYGTQENA